MIVSWVGPQGDSDGGGKPLTAQLRARLASPELYRTKPREASRLHATIDLTALILAPT